ncbi:unnamed protein product [Miscanthus lutarioriparius]|uniref:Uncharacterized protein n=1 Tax=Miscanthus lutarioriparius TaxID=422564 RepID=A0A811PS06_9POAL|nr:unnamed protein product [Miscanthus lutarioriparius]
MDSNNLLAAWPVVGPGVAGAVFGAGWWFWVDAVVCSAAAVPFLHYLPGFFASFAALMFNAVNREDIGDGYYSPYDDSEWRYGTICVDWHCWCPAVRFCVSEWVDLLDVPL